MDLATILAFLARLAQMGLTALGLDNGTVG
jgi:hypothetical protein